MPIGARHVEFTARPGRGEELAAVLVEVGDALRATPGCDRWVVSRVEGAAELVVVDESWADREVMVAAAEASEDDERLPRVRALLDPAVPPRVQELAPVGGAGLLEAPAPGVTHRRLLDTEDQAAAHGFGSQGASRFATGDLELRRTGLALHTMPPGAVSAFAHRHANAEEVYVVLGGTGRLHADGEPIELRAHDAVRVAPTVERGFEAGPDGLEVLVAGPRCTGDGEVVPGWAPGA